MSDDTNTFETLILTDDAEGVRTITLNRPDARNAFDTALYAATGSALDAADADDSVRVVILAGAGKGFSAGQDLKEMAKIDPSTRDDTAAKRASTASVPSSTRSKDSRSRWSRRCTAPPSGSEPRCSRTAIS